MSAQVQEDPASGVVTVVVSGKLTAEDYEHFVPELARFIQSKGKIRILFHMKDFHGWKLSAVWEDTKFSLHHYSDIERVAFVGDREWEKGMAAFCRPFTKSALQYFDESQIDEARRWLSA
jgi:hypothetical protein